MSLSESEKKSEALEIDEAELSARFSALSKPAFCAPLEPRDTFLSDSFAAVAQADWARPCGRLGDRASEGFLTGCCYSVDA